MYKLENWQLGFLDGRSGFAAQRQRTLRSHPSVRFERGYRYLETPHAAEVERLVGPICDAVPQSRYRPALVRTIRGYTDDMLDVMSKASASLRSGGHLVYVVGNSYHGGHNGIVVAADLIMARVGELCGLDISAMDVARVPTRRRTESAFLRETVVFARKP